MQNIGKSQSCVRNVDRDRKSKK